MRAPEEIDREMQEAFPHTYPWVRQFENLLQQKAAKILEQRVSA